MLFGGHVVTLEESNSFYTQTLDLNEAHLASIAASSLLSNDVLFNLGPVRTDNFCLRVLCVVFFLLFVFLFFGVFSVQIPGQCSTTFY